MYLLIQAEDPRINISTKIRLLLKPQKWWYTNLNDFTLSVFINLTAI